MVPNRAGLGLVLAVTAVAGACDDSVRCGNEPAGVARPESWTLATHCDGVRPDYAGLFDAEVVHRFELEISADDYRAAMDDMEDWYAEAAAFENLDGMRSPIWVDATVRFGGHGWPHVAMRYKGHASLKGAWGNGWRKLAFVLDFDELEEAHPEISDQRFHGFRRLSFSNAYLDPSLLRDKLAGEIFRDGGVPTARSAFAAVYLDWGDDSAYLGLYTMIEDPCDKLLETQLGDGSGNLYKPWGEAARWLDPGTVGEAELAEHFETCELDDPADRSEVRAAIAALHASRTVAAEWRAGLERALDVDSFLRTLAFNQLIVNWDSYGCMPHNYYVYANPRDAGRLLWFPWDLNESMFDREKSGCPRPGSVMLTELWAPRPDDPVVTGDWPLIAYLLADPVYCRAYRDQLELALGGEAFDAERLLARSRRYHDLIAPWVVGPQATEEWPYVSNGAPETFPGSLTEGDAALEPHLAARRAAVREVLDAPSPCP